MRLSETRVQELQALYRKHFKKDISTEEAQRQGIAIMRAAVLLSQPAPQEKDGMDMEIITQTKRHASRNGNGGTKTG